ncbi:MAG TPA: tRNA (N6-isopentenyl adenosine(37)-C2)-methylthiotransferase MiaB [Thermoanaerobaculia bacterium]|nr:tRNA (N6-isopentenyl adenosine(37)-C2)-methylthiotransferase MiaB [Thermoanaerobaculia bacterium]
MDNTFYIETWGCQMNDLDTQRISGQLKLRGYRRVENPSDASLLMLNTCSIREKSEHKVFTRLGQLRTEKARGARIGVSGCVAQQEGEAIIKRAPYVDFVIGPGSIGYLDEALEGRQRVVIGFPEDRRYDFLSLDRPSATRAQITVVEGCNKNCTFCIVPTTRGREVSRTFASVLEEAAHAVSSGRVELELLGQTVNAYRCPAGGQDFADLLGAVAVIPGVRRVRFMTSHPAEMSARLIDVMREQPTVSRYLHLPVQSGSSAVLRRMKRLYTRERYLEIIASIRSSIPGMQFSTDVIVGFPGETDADFQQTLSLMATVRFGSLFAFKYSPRPGTAALRLGAPVSDAVASDRLAQVFALQESVQQEILQGYTGKTVEVMHEGFSKHDPSILTGRTDDNWTVNYSGDPSTPPGTMLPVRIAEARHYTLRGEA